MNSFKIWLRPAALAVGLLASHAWGQCNATDNGGIFTISRQEQLDALAQECTILHGDIVISCIYYGPFVLNNITDIIGNLQTDFSGWTRPHLTSVDLPVLRSVSSIYIHSETVETISVPSLVEIPKLQLRQSSTVATAHFGSLVTADLLDLEGNYTSVTFEALQSVTGFMTFCNSGCRSMVGPAAHSMDLSFPSLEHASGFQVIGNLSSLSVPALTEIGPNDDSNASLMLDVDSPVHITFPKLSYVQKQMTVAGAISCLSLPAMEHMSTLQLQPTERFDINFPFETLDTLQAQGNIASIELPNLCSVNSLSITSNMTLDCQGFYESLEEQLQHLVEDNDIVCTSASDQPKKSLSISAKAGISVGCSLFALFAAAALFMLIKRQKRKKQKQPGLASGTELSTAATTVPAREHHEEPPPPYSPREQPREGV